MEENTPSAKFLEQWVKIFTNQENPLILTYSIVVPQWILISLMVKKDAEFKSLCKTLHTDPLDGHKGVMGAVQSLVEALDQATGVPT